MQRSLGSASLKSDYIDIHSLCFSYHPSVILTFSPIFTKPHWDKQKVIYVGWEGWWQNLPQSPCPSVCSHMEQSPCTATQTRYRNPFLFTYLYCSVTTQNKRAWAFCMYCPLGWVRRPGNTKFRVAKCLEYFVSEAWCIFGTVTSASVNTSFKKREAISCNIHLCNIDLGCVKKLVG